MLKELFNWLNTPATEIKFSNQLISQKEIQFEKLEQLRKIRINELDQSHLSDPQKEKKSIEAQDPLPFIVFCDQEASPDQPMHLFELGLRYLLSRNVNHHEKIINQFKVQYLFAKYFDPLFGNQEMAIQFYLSHKESFRHFPGIQSIVNAISEKNEEVIDKTKVNYYLTILNKKLVTQKKAIDITPLFITKADNAHEFAAYILWLLHRGYSPAHIIKTLILQRYFEYHFTLIHSNQTHNPLNQLYGLLSQFIIAKPLIEFFAKEYGTGAPGCQFYSIYGTQDRNKRLEIINNESTDTFQFTTTKENFDQLYALFGDDFLIAALELLRRKFNNELYTLLMECLNTQISIKKLSNLITHYAHANKDMMLALIASLLSDATIKKFFSEKNPVILYLESYHDRIIQAVESENVPHYIKWIQTAYDTNFGRLSLLSILLKVMNNKNKSVAGALFEQILNILMLDPMNLDDSLVTHLIKIYKNNDHAQAIISNKLSSITINYLLQLKNICFASPLCQATLNQIEDHWLKVKSQLNIFSLFVKMNYIIFPENKYAVYIRVIDFYIRKTKNVNCLMQFLSLLPLPTSNTEVSERERLLVEIMTTPALREHPKIDEIIKIAILQLENDPIHQVDWWKKEYNGITIFSKAFTSHHETCIKNCLDILDSKYVLDITFINHILSQGNDRNLEFVVKTIANHDYKISNQNLIHQYLLQFSINAKRLDIVKLLCEANSYSSEIIKSLFTNATISDNLTIFGYLNKKFPLSEELIIDLIQCAVTHEKLSLIQYLFQAGTHNPSKEMLKSRFEAMLATKKFKLIRKIVVDISTSLDAVSAFTEVLQDNMIKQLKEKNILDNEIMLFILNPPNHLDLYKKLINFTESGLLDCENLKSYTKIQLLKKLVLSRKVYNNLDQSLPASHLLDLAKIGVLENYFDLLFDKIDYNIYLGSSYFIQLNCANALTPATCDTLIYFLKQKSSPDFFVNICLELQSLNLMNSVNFLFFKPLQVDSVKALYNAMCRLKLKYPEKEKYREQMMTLLFCKASHLLDLSFFSHPGSPQSTELVNKSFSL